MQITQDPMLYGWLALVVLYIVSILVTRSLWPWALAQGYNGKLSASLLQFWAFTIVTVFAYVTTAAARILQLAEKEPMIALPEIPINLLILMGLSVATVTSSKSLTISYLQKGEIPQEDKGNLVENREGSTDLVKAQMLIWTAIAIVIYLLSFNRFIAAQCYLPMEKRATDVQQNSAACPEGFALPDVDGSLLVLMGVSQGGYVAGKLVSRSIFPKVDLLVPNKVKAGDTVNIYGISLGESKEDNGLLLEKAENGALNEISPGNITEWKDSSVRFTFPKEFAPETGQPAVKYQLKIRVNSQTSPVGEIEVSAAE